MARHGARLSGPASGFTLFELLILVAIIAVLAAIAIPSTAPADDAALDAAAAEVTEALRFARLEAMRTGTVHGVRFDTGAATSRIRVFQYDLTAPAPSESYTVPNPVEHKIYDITLAARPVYASAYLQAATFSAGLTTITGVLGFDVRGTPVILQGTSATALTSGSITLAAGSRSRAIHVDGQTGRAFWS